MIIALKATIPKKDEIRFKKLDLLCENKKYSKIEKKIKLYNCKKKPKIFDKVKNMIIK